MQNYLTEHFNLGCNYWASNAGCFMWQQWDEECVASDLKLLAQNHLTTLRVFPLWSDFQPIKFLYGEFGRLKEVRLNEEPLDNSILGQAGIDPVMVERFERLCELAAQNSVSLTVMLLTGWMSGRQFKPDPLQALNVYTDPISLEWQAKFVKAFVRHFKKYDCIIGWGLGNESNVMSECPSPHAAYSWTALISNTIRAADPDRPVISGMHGLHVTSQNFAWTIEDQGQLCDVMTVHPYSLFVPHCDKDPLRSLRNTMHLAAESSLYSDLTGKSCMTEEIGDLSSGVSSKESSKTYCDTVLRSCWANNDLGCLWWCAFQQDDLKPAPYDWFLFEQDLGLFSGNHNPKPVVDAYREFSSMLHSLPQEYRKLPSRKRDAVCLLTNDQDQWAAALASFILSKQAGFDISFVGPCQELPDSNLYLLPSLCGLGSMERRKWLKIMDMVERAGATVYMSCINAILPILEQFAGLKILGRKSLDFQKHAVFSDGERRIELPTAASFLTSRREGGTEAGSSQFSLILESTGANLLAVDQENNPLFAEFNYGKGKVFFLNFGLEMMLSMNSGSFHRDSPDYAGFYRTIAADAISQRLLKQSADNRMLALTEHPIDETKTVCTGVNHSFETMKVTLHLDGRIKRAEVLAGSVELKEGQVGISLGPGKGFVLELTIGQKIQNE